MKRLESIGAWFRKWWIAFLVGAAVLLGLLLANRRRVGRLRDELAVVNAVAEVASLRAVRAHWVADDAIDAEAVGRIDREIQKHKRAIIEAHDETEGFTDDEVDAELARLGY